MPNFKQARLPFNPKGSYVATKNFRFVGRDYTIGQEFPWRQLSCSTRKLAKLWEGRFINLVGDESDDKAESPPLPELTVEDLNKDLEQFEEAPKSKDQKGGRKK